MTADGGARRRFARPRTSIRLRVTVLATVVVSVVLVGAGVAIALAQQRMLTENLDEAIAQEAASIATVLAAGDPPIVLGGFGDDDSVAQVVSATGQVVAATPNVAGRPAIAPASSVGRSTPTRTVHGLPVDDVDFRLLTLVVRSPEGPVTIHVAASLGDVRESRDVLVRALVVGVPVVVVLLAGLIWWLVGRTLRPVEAIRAEVAEISGSDLHRRVPEPATGDEIAQLARTMNAMLDRVEGATRRQQGFVADASHELRSPLARMRTELEVDLAHPDRADPLKTHHSVLDETAGLQRLVEDLLHLARSDAGGGSRMAGPVDLDDIVLVAARSARSGGRVAVDTSGVAAAQVRGDGAQLARAVGNLADNAVRHATSAVTFSCGQHGDVAVVAVGDDGPGIPPQERERVFERFTRLDGSRQSTTGGPGLGLAIARDIAVRHGGTLVVDDDDTSPGARLVLTLPLTPTDQ